MLSQNPSTVGVRRWYRRHANEPEIKERLRRYCREYRKRNRENPEYKKRKAASDLRGVLKVRGTTKFKSKRNAIAEKWMATNPKARQIFRESTARWRRRNPGKVKAHEVVRKAIRAGVLVRPSRCTACHKIPKRRKDGRSGMHAHHRNHRKPLEVDWLCAPCHAIHRRKYQ